MSEVRTSSYLGATESELRAAAAKLLWRSPDARFPHHGMLTVEPEALVLGGWRVIPRSTIRSIDLTFNDVYSRSMATGQNLTLGFFGDNAKALVLGLSDGEPVYLLIGWRRLTTTNQNSQWLPLLQEWLAAPPPVELESEASPESHSPPPAVGWYVEPGTGRQRWWTGTAWGNYAPHSAPPAGAPAGAAYAPGQPAAYTPGQPTPGTNGFAIASLVLAFMWGAGLLSLLAVIFGAIGLRQAARRNQRQGLAIAGLLLGIAGVIGALLLGTFG